MRQHIGALEPHLVANLAASPLLGLARRKRAPGKRGGAKERTTTVDANGNTIVTEYDDDGRIKTISKYDPAGKLIEKIVATPQGGFVDTDYGADGKPTFVSDYDALGRRTVLRAFHYDADGNLVEVDMVIFERDDKGRLVSTHHTSDGSDADGKLTRHSEGDVEYDGHGRTKRSTQHSVDYDDKGKPSGGRIYIYDPPDDNGVSREDETIVDKDGKIISRKITYERNGKTIEEYYYDYTPPGHLSGNTVTRNHANGSPDRVTETEYDADGRVKKRITTETHAGGSRTEKETRYQRDADGNVVKTTIIEREYDADGAETSKTTRILK